MGLSRNNFASRLQAIPIEQIVQTKDSCPGMCSFKKKVAIAIALPLFVVNFGISKFIC